MKERQKKTIVLSKNGLTLVEVAIVLVILGLLIGLGASLIGPLTKRAKINETKETLNANVEAIISWAAANKRLPNFIENFSDCTNNSNDFRCVIRNRNDAWGRLFYYVVDSDLAQNLLTGTEHKICDRSRTKINIRFCRDFNCSNPQDIPNVAFILFSPGENGNDQTYYSESFNGTSLVINIYEPGLKIDRYSSSQSSSCQINKNVNGYPQDRCNQEEEYDDIVKWITLDELRTKVGCQGAQLKILNNELPYGSRNSLYASETNPVLLIAEGGVPFINNQGQYSQDGKYKWCFEWSNKPTNITKISDTGLYLKKYVNETKPDDIKLSNNCQDLPEDQWTQSDKVAIYGTPNPSYSNQTSYNYHLTFYVRDNNDSTITSGESSKCSNTQNKDNCASKSLVLTINPGGPCSFYRVWNQTGGAYDFKINNCYNSVANGSEITSSEYLTANGSITRYKSTNGNCPPGQQEQTLTYSQAQAADTNGNCQVNFTLSGFTDR